MKINTTVLLTLILLTLMLGAGSASGFLGFTLGSMALKGVTTPDGRPATKFNSSKANNPQQESEAFLKEEDILKVVKSRISDQKRVINQTNQKKKKLKLPSRSHRKNPQHQKLLNQDFL